MIAGVRGILELRTADYAVVVVGGVSFKVLAPTSTLAQLGNVGDEVRLHTHLYAREDVLALYGFLSEADLRMFELLLTVSGIGPRAAINILSAVSLDTLRMAIGTGKSELLTKVPGIGRKTADRMVLELRGKIDMSGLPAGLESVSVEDAEVVAALTSLGYGTAEAQAAVSSLSGKPELTLEEKIVLALRFFGEKG
ncbi:MAG TPA: Holliday junction branch migration protein RuvA [Chloroflexota bacterium]|nr:Holliday junction branch migration protein RuvA [Chloroflexota bacterium]